MLPFLLRLRLAPRLEVTDPLRLGFLRLLLKPRGCDPLLPHEDLRLALALPLRLPWFYIQIGLDPAFPGLALAFEATMNN